MQVYKIYRDTFVEPSRNNGISGTRADVVIRENNEHGCRKFSKGCDDYDNYLHCVRGRVRVNSIKYRISVEDIPLLERLHIFRGINVYLVCLMVTLK